MHGVINLNKPGGLTSHDAVTRVKRILKARKAGHAGTLDPMATGVLLVCLGEATKISRFLLDLGKEYRAVLKLGERTDTFDAEGEIIERKGLSAFDHENLSRILPKFRGKILQLPPMFSAVKVSGKPLYRLARKGQEVDRPVREVEITRLEVARLDLPYLALEIACSKGTYIRSIAEDIGNLLGTGAHLVSLERTAVGQFRVEDAASVEDLGSGRFSFISIKEALRHLPDFRLDAEDTARIRNGQQIDLSVSSIPGADGPLLLSAATGEPVGIGVKISNKIKPERIFYFPEFQEARQRESGKS